MSIRNFDHTGIQQVVVENFASGSISIEPSPQPDLVEGSLNHSDETFLDSIVVRQDHDTLRIALPDRFFGGGSTHLRLGAPNGTAVQIKSGSADISASIDLGRSKLTSGSGDISLGQVAELECAAGSGSVSITHLRGEAKLTTGSGDITIGQAFAPLSAKSGSGDIRVRSLHRAPLEASTGSGDIAVPSTTGSVDLRSASGSLTIGVADQLPAWLDLNSVSGRVRVAIEPGEEPGPGEPYVSVRARTASGEIAVYRA